MTKTKKVIFKSKIHVVCLFDTFMTIEKTIGGGARIDQKHSQFRDWYTAFDDIESVNEGDRLCRSFCGDKMKLLQLRMYGPTKKQ